MSHLWSKQSILGMLIRVQEILVVAHKQPNKILLLANPWVRRGEGGVFFSFFWGWGPNFPIYFSNQDKRKAHFYYGLIGLL
jgi:hypothetical protein